MIDGLTRDFKYTKGGVDLVGFNTQIVDHGIGLQKIHQFEGTAASTVIPFLVLLGLDSRIYNPPHTLLDVMCATWRPC